ncbi:hypothetical protein CKCBHOJB_02459 [Thauera sp. GDN1]|nr:hypothetical protein CKCBHOJB_02459 [Thauera sp. GDN1]
MHALEGVEVQIQQAVARFACAAAGQRGRRARGLRLQQAGQRRQQQGGGVLGVHARQVVERCDGLAQRLGGPRARRTQREPGGNGVAHGIQTHRQRLAGRLQALAQFRFHMWRLQRRQAFADARGFAVEHRA